MLAQRLSYLVRPAARVFVCSISILLSLVGSVGAQNTPDDYVHFTGVGLACPSSDATVTARQRRQAEEILYALARNRSVLKERNRAFKVPALVVVDSGVYTSRGYPFFSDEFNDAYYQTYPPERLIPWDSMNAQDKGHGTKVATLALGGPHLVHLLFGLDALPTLQPINMYWQSFETLRDESGKPRLNDRSEPIRIEKFTLSQATIHNVLQQGVHAVVNLSIGRSAPIGDLEKLLTKYNSTIFVVAAGNSGGNLVSTDVYPAKYGGTGNPGQYNLITVAAVDGNNHIAKFSNRAKQHVDIAALGCDVETLEFDDQAKQYRPVRVSGTSFAAPQVAAVTALIRGTTADFSRLPASAIRSRVLASSELHPSLSEHIEDGRVLNPARALASIFFDALDFRDPARTQVRGYAKLRAVEDFCAARAHLPADAKLLRLARYPTDSDRFLYYWTDKQQLLKSGNCQVKTGATLNFVDDATLNELRVPLPEIGDLVLAMFPTVNPHKGGGQ